MSVFFTEIYSSTVIPFAQLFQEGMTEMYSANNLMNEANIYFVGKVNKVRFDLEKTVLLDNNVINIAMTSSGRPDVNITKPIFEVSRKAKELHDIISSNDQFSFDEMFTFRIDYNQSKTKLLTVVIDFVGRADRHETFDISLYEVLNVSEDELKINPEVVYIGQSRNLLTRFRKHGTILKAASILTDHEELLLYFITFRVGYGGRRKELVPSVSTLTSNMDRSDKSYWSLITILERVLIYFFQPVLNEMHMKTPIETDAKIKSLLVDAGVTGITVGTGVYGNFHTFWTPNQKLKDDFFSYNFSKPSKGFTSSLDEDFLGF